MVYGISNATDIIGGYMHTCAINRGSVECWGSNSFGQLGFESDSAIVPFANHVRAAVDSAP
jgi:alpha-tubulin suppressor-like RCC1 family protein